MWKINSRCGQSTADVFRALWRLWPMQVAHVRRRLAVVCTVRAMQECQERPLLNDVNSPQPMQPVHAWPMYTFHVWCYNLRPMSPYKYSLSLADFIFADTNMPLIMLPAFSRRLFWPAGPQIPWLMLAVVGKHIFPKAHQPLLMLPNVGLFEGCLDGAHMPWQLRAGLDDATFR